MTVKSNTSVIALLAKRAHETPNATAYVFLDEAESGGGSLTYAELHHRASSIAALLKSELDEARGQRALLLYPPGIEFIEAFFGCLYAGVIAIPCPIPGPPRARRALARLQVVIDDAQAPLVLSNKRVGSKVKAGFKSAEGGLVLLRRTRIVETDGPLKEGAEPQLDEREGPAYLQYTSGSTGAPKGVMVTHANLVANLERFAAVDPVIGSGAMVSWVPAFHDMGLVYGVLYPLYRGDSGYLMSPAAFMKQPMRWLEAISNYRATHTCAPNFAYALCTRKSSAAQRNKLDLRSWQVALNGAEPVRTDTIEQFCQAFASAGFRQETFAPAYGLAEATLVVSISTGYRPEHNLHLDRRALEQGAIVVRHAPTDSTQTFVSCGHALRGTKVRIVDRDTSVCVAPDRVGEIWVAGPHVAAGYWGKSKDTRETFEAEPSSADGEYLRTGDLGFVHKNHLYITGRIDDVLIVRGRNLYPHDIEGTVQELHGALRGGCGAAFMTKPGAGLTIVQELAADRIAGTELDGLYRAARAAVAADHGVELEALCLIPPRTIFKTSSGKIQRRATRAHYTSRTLEIIKEWQMPNTKQEQRDIPVLDAQPYLRLNAVEVEGWMCEHVAQMLLVPKTEIDRTKPLHELGFDSQDSLELVSALEERVELTRELPSGLVAEYATITAIAARVVELASQNVRVSG